MNYREVGMMAIEIRILTLNCDIDDDDDDVQYVPGEK